MSKYDYDNIEFFAEKVYFHHWPPETPKWSDSIKNKIALEINSNSRPKHITIDNKTVKINDYLFSDIKKIGLTIPQFKRQCTMIFEGHSNDFDAHAHIITRDEKYLEIFYNLMKWRDLHFPDTPFS